MTTPAAKKSNVIEEAISKIEGDVRTIIKDVEKEVKVADNDVKNILPRIKALFGPNLIHAFGLLGTLGAVFTHDLTKIENVLAPIIGLGITTSIKKVSAKVPAK